MLETSSSLTTWTLVDEPAAGMTIAAARLADHRLDYLNYEGPVSGNRGHVARWDSGLFAFERQDDNEVVVRLAGEKLRGRATLTREMPETQRWRFLFVAEPTSA